MSGKSLVGAPYPVTVKRTEQLRNDRPSGAKITLGDVAIAAGVSPAAASLALRGRRGVSDQTRERVIEVASSLGYRRRSAAERSETLRIGVLVRAKGARSADLDAFYGPVLAGINAEASLAGIDLRLDTLLVDDDFDPLEVPRSVQSADIDGLLVLGARLTARSADQIAPNPVVLVDGYSDPPRTFSSVIADNVAGACAATQHLIDLGHQHIALAGSTPTAFPSIQNRRLGYRQTVAAAGLPAYMVDGPHDQPHMIAAQVALELERNPDISAIFAVNDDVAIAIIGAMGSEIPSRLSLVGFDDIAAARVIHPRLDTVAVDKQALGRFALTLAAHRIRHPDDPPVTATLPASLVVRDSSAIPPTL